MALEKAGSVMSADPMTILCAELNIGDKEALFTLSGQYITI